MTIAQLEALLQEHFPEAAAHLTQQGRAGVTNDLVNRARYESLQHDPSLRTGAPQTTMYRYWEQHRVCLVCGKVFDRNGTRKKHCGDACKQKAYRQRRKKRAA